MDTTPPSPLPLDNSTCNSNSCDLMLEPDWARNLTLFLIGFRALTYGIRYSMAPNQRSPGCRASRIYATVRMHAQGKRSAFFCPRRLPEEIK